MPGIYDFTGVKKILTPWGELSSITDAAGVVIWKKKTLYQYQYEKTTYVWKKYTYTSTTTKSIAQAGNYHYNTAEGAIRAYKNVKLADDDTIVGVDEKIANWDEYISNSAKIYAAYPYLDTRSAAASYNEWAYVASIDYSDNTAMAYTLSVTTNTSYVKADYLGEVTNTSKSAYPTNGRSGDYWYVYDRADIETVTVESEYRLTEGASTSLSMSISTTVTGYASIWVDDSGEIHGGGDAYNGRWRTYYNTFLSTYPYLYYNNNWYKLTAASSSKATVLPLSTTTEAE